MDNISFTGANLVLFKDKSLISKLDKAFPKELKTGIDPIVGNIVEYRPNKDGFYRYIICDEVEAINYLALENGTEDTLLLNENYYNRTGGETSHSLKNKFDISMSNLGVFFKNLENTILLNKKLNILDKNYTVFEIKSEEDIKNIPILKNRKTQSKKEPTKNPEDKKTVAALLEESNEILERIFKKWDK